MNDNEYIAKLTVPVEDAALVASLLRKTVSEKWWEGITNGLPFYASNAQSDSATWTSKTPEQILADVNSALERCYMAPESCPDYIIVSPYVYWQLGTWPTIALLIRSRRQRRPKNFTQRQPKWAPSTKIWITRRDNEVSSISTNFVPSRLLV